MAASYVIYQAVGDSYLFPIPFQFLNPSFIEVSMASGTLQQGLDYNVEGLNIRFIHYPPIGAVTIRRRTPVSALLVPFSDGALLNARVMSSATSQALHGLEETRDYIEAVRDELTANLTPADSPLIASQLTGMQVSLDNVSASIANESTVRASADLALTSSVTALTSRVGATEASITAESATRATNDDALAYVVNQITAATGGAQALQQTGGLFSSTWTAAQANFWTNLKAEVFTAGGSSIRAALASEASVRASADSAMATNITSLTSRVGGAEAAITTEQTTRASADSTLAGEITTLKSRMGSAESAITTEQTTRASGDSANAASITSLTTRMNSAESSITTEATTRATQYGNLSAQYTLKLDINGNIAGFDVASAGTVAGGTTSKFRVRADRFEVTTPGMGNHSPFSVGGLSANMLANTEFSGGFTPFAVVWNPGGCAPLELRADDVWRPRGGQALQLYQAGRSGNPYNTGADVYPTGASGTYSKGIPVTPGKRYEFSARLASHRADSGLWIYFFDANDQNIAGSGVGSGWVARNSGGPSMASNSNGSGWTHACVFGTAPANAAYASPYWRKSDTDPGMGDSYAWITQPFFGEATAVQTLPSAYSPGFSKGAFASIDRLTSSNIATYMDAAVIKAAYIGDAEVGTLKIAGEAVTVPRFAESYASVAKTSTGTWTTVLSLPPMPAAGSPVVVLAGVPSGVEHRLLKNGTPIFTFPAMAYRDSYIDGNGVGQTATVAIDSQRIPCVFFDPSPGESVVYSIQAYLQSTFGNGTYSGYRFIYTMGTKR